MGQWIWERARARKDKRYGRAKKSEGDESVSKRTANVYICARTHNSLLSDKTDEIFYWTLAVHTLRFMQSNVSAILFTLKSFRSRAIAYCGVGAIESFSCLSPYMRHLMYKIVSFPLGLYSMADASELHATRLCVTVNNVFNFEQSNRNIVA